MKNAKSLLLILGLVTSTTLLFGKLEAASSQKIVSTHVFIGQSAVPETEERLSKNQEFDCSVELQLDDSGIVQSASVYGAGFHVSDKTNSQEEKVKTSVSNKFETLLKVNAETGIGVIYGEKAAARYSLDEDGKLTSMMIENYDGNSVKKNMCGNLEKADRN